MMAVTLCRVADVIDVYGDLVMLVRAPAAPGEPWPTVVFPLSFQGDEPFRDVEPADFAERRAREGRIVAAADAWCCWTEER